MAVTAKSMSGRICMVTGANAGIGKATALGLAKMGGTVVMVCRSRERGEATLAEIKREFGSASILRDGRVVFNIAGNKYRIVVWINYPYRVVYIRFIGTHAQYDRIDAQTI